MGGDTKIASLLRFLMRKPRGPVEDVRAEHQRMLGSVEWRQPFRTMTFTAIDCEMTGLDPARDEILSIGAVRVRNHRVLLNEGFYQVFAPTEAVSPKDVILIHGLATDEVNRGSSLSTALRPLLEFLGDSIVVGFYTGLDLQFLNAALQKHVGATLRNPALDTLLLYDWWRRSMWHFAGGPGKGKLEEIAAEMGLPRYPAHNAFYDALTTALLFLKLLNAYEGSGAVQFRALYREVGVY
jgi:DNA polymerase-3 subunit epsilon